MGYATTSTDIASTLFELHNQTRASVAGQFVTTAATCKVYLAGAHFRRIRVVGIGIVGVPATDETLYVDLTVHTVTTGGHILALQDANGNWYVQIARTGASPTSGLQFNAEVIGFPA